MRTPRAQPRSPAGGRSTGAVIALLLSLGALAAPLAALAQNTAVASGDWFTGGTWSLGTAPVFGDGDNDVRIENSATVTLSGGSASVSLNIFVGSAATGHLQVSGGTFQAGRHFRVARLVGSVGSVHMTGGLIRSHFDNVSGATVIGHFGDGYLTVDGGTFHVGPAEGIGTHNPAFEGGDLRVGHDAGSFGKLVINENGLVQAARYTVIARNDGSVGVLEINGGTHTSDGQVIIGNGFGSLGSLVVTGGYLDTDFDNNIVNFRRLIVGNDGTGIATVSGGTIGIGGGFRIGGEDDGKGTFFQSGGLVIAARDGGGQQMAIGRVDGGVGYVRLSGGTLDHRVSIGVDEHLDVGDAGAGVLELTGGAFLQTTTDVALGRASTGIGTFDADGGALVAENLRVGIDGIGHALIGGNTSIDLADDLSIGTGSGSTGSIQVSGGSIHLADDVLIGSPSSSNAFLEQTGGIIVVDGSIDHTHGGTHIFTGGTLTRTGIGTLSYLGDFTFSSTATVKLDTDKSLVVSGGFDGAGGGAFGLTGLAVDSPNPDTLTVETATVYFATIGDRTGATGGTDLSTNTALEATALTGFPLPPLTNRISELAFENTLFNPSTQRVYALVEEQLAGPQGRLALRWSIAPEAPAMSFLIWTAAAGLLGADALPGADPEPDLIDNLDEYAFNLDPTLPDHQNLTAGTGTAGLPLITTVGVPPNDHLRVEYLRRIDATDVAYTVQFANDLSTTPPDGWTDFAGLESVTPIDIFWERVVVEDTVTAAVEPARYGRVQVTYTPGP